ncbi:hypothetical protein GP486_001463 [Trichoglossum hirsutum]|uniref:Cupin-like domain-containing protein n=1 Tax=Trichoglossum hirsutum TaxID=265104 RepID=A0A9P8LGU0_9PEZI|nr:hypothetical protein GP486_001463 [Trichoglossum hirsutum]
MDADSVGDAISGLIRSYGELNSQCVDELEEEPSPLEFMRYAAINRPFVIRGGCSRWRATKVWTAGYLEDRMGGDEVKVAITPHGKSFTLLPPLEVACVGERTFRSATYVRDEGERGLRIEEDEGGQEVPFPTWDPDRPEIRPTKFSHLSKPLRVELNAGDMLYLPALW